MELELLIQTKIFLEEMSVSIRNILLASFPELSREEKEDIDHEVKLKLWKKVASGKKIDNLRSYLWKVVYTTALDEIGERMSCIPLEKLMETPEQETPPAAGVASPDIALQEKEMKLLLEKAVGALPERRKAVLQLHFSGMDLRQIATSLSWRENQVRHLLYRGLSDVRKKIMSWKEI
jgi:RNA polymerase sigma factor (sigma-70 family)